MSSKVSSNLWGFVLLGFFGGFLVGGRGREERVMNKDTKGERGAAIGVCFLCYSLVFIYAIVYLPMTDKCCL